MTSSGPISLRPLLPDDRAKILVWRNLPEVAANMYSDHLIAAEEHDAWFDRARRDGAHLYRVVEATDVGAIGLVSFTSLDNPSGSCVWGGYLADTTSRGKGIGKVALWLCLEMAFSELARQKVCVEAFADNSVAIGLYETLGFRREAFFRQHVLKDRRRRDVVGLGLLAQEWTLLEPGVRSGLESKGLLW